MIKTNEFKLSDIFIGKADGEIEANEDNFMSMFYTGNNKLQELSDKSKFIITGRKGTGKTVLAKYFLKDNENKSNVFIGIYDKLINLTLHKVIEFKNDDVDRNTMFHFQKYCLYIELSKYVINNKKSLIKNFKRLKQFLPYIYNYRKLKKFYSAKYNDDIFDIKSRTDEQHLASGISASLPKVLSSSIDSSLSTKDDKVLKNFSKLINSFETKLFNVIQYLDIVFVIDDFDEYITDDQLDKTYDLMDFLINIRNINNDFQQKKINCRVIALLRDDIINSFSSRHPNIEKMLFDCQVELNWVDNHNKKELQNMICNKIKNSNSKLQKYDLNDIRDYFFPSEKNKNKYPGRKRYTNSFKNALGMTFGRPRDIVMLLNIMRNQNLNSPKFTTKMIQEASMDYSNHLISEIKNEMTFRFDPDTIDSIFNLLINFKKNSFNFSEIESFYNENSQYYNLEPDLKAVLNELYKFGVIGNISSNDVKNHHSHTWSYYSNAPKSLNFNDIITIHNGVRKGLNHL